MTDLTVSVWHKLAAGWGKVGEVRTWRDLSAEWRHNQPGPWSVATPFDTQALKLAKDRLMTVDFRGLRFTGVVEHFSPHSDETGKPALEVSGLGALSILGDLLCWPDPSSPIGAQAAARWKATGVAETVLRDLLVANLGRAGYDVVVPASGGRGSTITLNERFSNLLTVVTTKATLGGLGVRAGLVNTTSSTRAALTVEFYEPADRSRRVRLSHDIGTLRAWKQNDYIPAATRPIVGGQGQGMGRVLRAPVTDATAEAQWGRRREVFVDARDVEKGSADETTILDQRAQEALGEGAAQSSFELDAVEAEGMRLGQHFDVGDQVTVSLVTGVDKAAPLGAARLAGSESGVAVQLIPGDPDGASPLFRQAALMRAIRRDVNALKREETV